MDSDSQCGGLLPCIICRGGVGGGGAIFSTPAWYPVQYNVCEIRDTRDRESKRREGVLVLPSFHWKSGSGAVSEEMRTTVLRET